MLLLDGVKRIPHNPAQENPAKLLAGFLFFYEMPGNTRTHGGVLVSTGHSEIIERAEGALTRVKT